MEQYMKSIGYRFLALIYNICTILFSIKNKIVLLNGHNQGLNGNLYEIDQEYRVRDEKCKIIFCSKRDLFNKSIPGMFYFFVIMPYHMATAKKVFFNDNFLPLAYMKTKNRHTQFVQLWHGAGAFKRFGLSTEEDTAVREYVQRANKNITHLFVTSKQIVPYYQEAFAIDENKIYPTGVPVTDFYFRESEKENRVQQFYQEYPELKGKKIALFTPTFRGTNQENDGVIEMFDGAKVKEVLGEEWIVIIKMHPKFPSDQVPNENGCINMTEYKDISTLYLVSDMLITDYSSTVVEYVLLKKPVVMFAYDLEKYDRGFYRDYLETVPGPVARTTEELLQCVKQVREDKQLDQDRYDNFVKLQYDYLDAKAINRVLNVLE